ncbi:tRNA A64-2'-O-ribosylphosphate transferase [Elasticomyces elasticus]|nr:tRNA A64-2'-O-ribosylphosphate transferase [Elasticomyces elasticus]KAK5004427.1 hypothetical protein LTR28_008931 [Elasticomyces elasticus]
MLTQASVPKEERREPLRTTDLIFPSVSTQSSKIWSSIKRSALTISNRLRSIEKDSIFVSCVKDAFNLPLVANERCGSWYVPPESKAGSAYFKSTDGHAGQWSFSLRRLNLQMLDIIEQHQGCIIVDSTRRGKSMPDALSKTVPIWCTVINRALFPEDVAAHNLVTPPSVVSASEHAQVTQRVEDFVADFLSLPLDFAAMRMRISKPLKPLWITPESGLPSSWQGHDRFHTIVLCTASRCIPGGEVFDNDYVQGAADDSESWACGLTPIIFWQSLHDLLNASEDDLPDTIRNIVQASHGRRDEKAPVLVKPTSNIFIGSETKDSEWEAVITCSPPNTETASPNAAGPKRLHLEIGSGKIGSRQLRHELSKVPAFVETLQTSQCPRILLASTESNDHATGVALALLCLYVGQSGCWLGQRSADNPVNKLFIKQRLSWIMASMPDASPSRATLQSVNAFLMG